MSEWAIEVRGLWKKFRRGQFHDSLRDALPALARRLVGRGPRSDELAEGDFWALRDVAFAVRRGEVLGLIGSNGAGKSTLLKILARILRPNRGTVAVHGRLGALIEVAAGFHPDLTGRENIYLNGSILGMRKREIDGKFDAIVAFSGIEAFLDTPVKRYSSGMHARLGFAVAAHLDPEILIVDEVLAVGDAEFQRRCLGKMGDAAKGGRTVLFVSHNLAALQNLCTRAVLLKKGELVMDGSPADAIARYLGERRRQDWATLRERSDREGNGDLRFESLALACGDGADADYLLSGATARFSMRFTARRPLRRPEFYLSVYDASGLQLLGFSTRDTKSGVESVEGPGIVECIVPRLPLPPGAYRINVAAFEAGTVLDRVEYAREFTVEAGDFYGTGATPAKGAARFLAAHSWRWPSAEVRPAPSGSPDSAAAPDSAFAPVGQERP